MPDVPPDGVRVGELLGRCLRQPWLPERVRLRRARSEMALRSSTLLGVRQACLDVAKNVLPPSTPGSTAVDGPVWQYWHAGITSAPPLVRRCMESVDEHLPGPVVRLSDATIADHVRLPAYLGYRDLTRTHLSDILRLHLLADHGGTWIDATVMLTGAMPADIVASPFFAFSRPSDPFLLSSWFLRSLRREPLVVSWRDALDRYWERNDTQSDYFLLHHLFESLVSYHQPLRDAWAEVPFHSYREPHLLQEVMLDDVRSGALAPALASSWIHKLTYRYPARGASEPMRVVDILVEGTEDEEEV